MKLDKVLEHIRGGWKRLRQVIWPQREPRWKRMPSHYNWCPNCKQIAVNVHWSLHIEYEPSESPNLLPSAEPRYTCPNCGHDVGIRELLRNQLDNRFDVDEL